MPLSRYDSAFGGKKGSATKAHTAMLQQYGADKGERVFYATKNKRSRPKRGGKARDQLVRQFMAGRKMEKTRGHQNRR